MMMALDGKTIEHESFGFIRANRVQGSAKLFDSAINHQHFISLTIGQANQERQLNRTWIFGGKELITVDMSESQFAQFITSMNSGTGSSCTIRRLCGKGKECPPEDMNTRQSFGPEMKEETAKVAELLSSGVAKLSALASQGKANKGELKAALDAVVAVQQQLVSTLPFIMKQFAEHMEELTDRAKSDLSAHALMLGQHAVNLPLLESADSAALETTSEEVG
jgi:hypothetical protein